MTEYVYTVYSGMYGSFGCDGVFSTEEEAREHIRKNRLKLSVTNLAQSPGGMRTVRDQDAYIEETPRFVDRLEGGPQYCRRIEVPAVDEKGE
ncbi:unnamed protein product [marine sediment metagenome]|uniref:Uncharacterized protein n=1 Tax=marine sediment metagenome TaxID=412755 RepID=X0T409_9ZZZZ